MLQCRITGNNDGQKFVRTYYGHTVINRNEFRGAATPERLAIAFPQSDTQVRIQMGDFGVMFDPENNIRFELSIQSNGQVERYISPVIVKEECTATLKINGLKFNVEIKDVAHDEVGSDPDEGLTIFQNCDIVVTRRANGIQVISKHSSECSIHIDSGNQFSDRLNVVPSDGTEVRLTNAKDRPMVQFLPANHQ